MWLVSPLVGLHDVVAKDLKAQGKLPEGTSRLLLILGGSEWLPTGE